MEKPRKLQSSPLETSTPLQLKYYFFPEVSSSAALDFDPEKDKGSRSLSLKIDESLQPTPKSPGQYQLGLRLGVGPKEKTKAPYRINLTIIGFFAVREDVPENQRETLVRITGSSMLYGMAREFIMAVTGRGPWPPVMLPTISFIPREKVKQKKASRTSKGGKPASTSQSPSNPSV